MIARIQSWLLTKLGADPLIAEAYERGFKDGVRHVIHEINQRVVNL
jgi:hypothetical protein